MCVSLDTPNWLKEFFLDRPCKHRGPDKQLLLWEVRCLNESDRSALVDRWHAESGSSRADLQRALALLAQVQSTCRNYTSKADCTATSSDKLASLPHNAAANTVCGKEVLVKFRYCCVDTDVASWPNQNLSGRLPDTFRLANLTDFSNNPALCGVLSGPYSSKSWASDTPPVRLYNSNVQVDVGKLAQEVTQPGLGIWIAAWLGSQDSRIGFNNLAGLLPQHEAFQVCMLFDRETFVMQQANYRCSVQQASCVCQDTRGPLFVTSQQVWDDCHISVMQFAFNNSKLQQRSLHAYNQYVKSKDSAFMCGEEGKAYRKSIVRLIWAIVVPSTYVVVVVALLVTEYWAALFARLGGCCNNPINESTCNCCSCCPCLAKFACWLLRVWPRYILPTIFLGLQINDIVSDWNFVFALAQYGNFSGLKVIGWVLWGSNILPAAASVPVVVLLILMLCRLYYEDWFELFAFILSPVIGMSAYILASNLVLGLTTRRIDQFAGHQPVLLGDVMELAIMFVAFSAPGILLAFCATVFGKYGAAAVRAKLSDTPRTEAWERIASADEHGDFWIELGIDLWYLFLEDVPQAALQAIFWQDGSALVSTKDYLWTGIGSAASLAAAAARLTALLARYIVQQHAVRAARAAAAPPAASVEISGGGSRAKVAAGTSAEAANV
jgi:hypothetical protein